MTYKSDLKKYKEYCLSFVFEKGFRQPLSFEDWKEAGRPRKPCNYRDVG